MQSGKKYSTTIVVRKYHYMQSSGSGRPLKSAAVQWTPTSGTGTDRSSAGATLNSAISSSVAKPDTDELSSESLNASQAAIALGERLDDEDEEDEEGAIVKSWMRFDSGDESDKLAWAGSLCSEDAGDEASSSKAC